MLVFIFSFCRSLIQADVSGSGIFSKIKKSTYKWKRVAYLLLKLVPTHSIELFFFSFEPTKRNPLPRISHDYIFPLSFTECYDAFHRKQLRKVLNIKYPVKITNSSLYNKCEEHPLSIYILENRWRLFGHILRRNIEIPANKSMNSYFATHGKKVLGPPFNNTTSRPQQRPIKTTRKHTTTHN